MVKKLVQLSERGEKMNPEIDKVLKEDKKRMEKTIEALKKDLGKIRTGRASLAILDGIKINYYGTLTPINQVASLSIPDSKTIMIQPWEPKFIQEIEKAIANSDIGLAPVNDGKVIRLNIPPLTEERRNELVKQTKKIIEQAKIAIRNIRRDMNDKLKTLQKEKKITEDELKKGQEKVQEITDEFIEKIDKIFEEKEKEIREF